MKRHFITGLVILLPVAVTLFLVVFILNIVTQPFVGFFEQFLEPYSWYVKYRAGIHFLVQIALIIGLFFVTVFIGFLARILVFRYFIAMWDKVIHRIPIIKSIYKASQQVMKTIFGSQSRSFKEVVLIPFPTQGGYCLGFVSGKAPTITETITQNPLVSVFVPTTPNPTSGYLIMYRKEDVIPLDMKIDEALKYIISCGVITSDEEPSLVKN